MSFEKGTATGIGDLLVKWFNFLQANGWTADIDFASASQSPAYGIIQRKVNLSPEDETTVNLHAGFGVGGIHSTSGPTMPMIPMRDYVSGDPEDGVEVGSAPSTNAWNSVTGNFHLLTNFPTDPFDNYWFFESDYYAHAVVEWSTGHYRHFGMGQLNKIGKWFGGEYYYGGFWDQSNAQIDSIISSAHHVGLSHNNLGSAGSAILYGKLLGGGPFPDVAGRQSPESAWHCGVTSGDTGSGVGTDGDSRDRGGIMVNCARSGYHYYLMGLGLVPFNQYRPMHPITVYTYYSGSNPDNCNPIGVQPDVRAISLEGSLEGGDEFTVGADTWVAFPCSRKQNIKTTDDVEQSGYLGYAYKKVTT
jgi:hypothetical protein